MSFAGHTRWSQNTKKRGSLILMTTAAANYLLAGTNVEATGSPYNYVMWRTEDTSAEPLVITNQTNNQQAATEHAMPELEVHAHPIKANPYVVKVKCCAGALPFARGSQSFPTSERDSDDNSYALLKTGTKARLYNKNALLTAAPANSGFYGDSEVMTRPRTIFFLHTGKLRSIVELSCTIAEVAQGVELPATRKDTKRKREHADGGSLAHTGKERK
ncbi:hypothetical protein GGX14DRAFT_405421 [Mycena pura]|uniref:Uncharacterized protein n=1 Tax=Mycena pura TaxID=153505 RepID=A0AAD6UVJ0_9AGAR|nr:hypothetical protein GGX14DRAFT_405421 [Mycena pura]